MPRQKSSPEYTDQSGLRYDRGTGNQIIGIAHADAYEDSLYVMEEIQKRIKVRDFINTSYDYCTGSHVGPDTIALFFMAKDRELGVTTDAK